MAIIGEWQQSVLERPGVNIASALKHFVVPVLTLTNHY